MPFDKSYCIVTHMCLFRPEYRHTKAMMSLVSLPIISALNLPPATTPLTMMLVVTSVGSTALYVMQDVSYYSTSHRFSSTLCI